MSAKEQRQETFLQVLAETGSVVRARRAAGVGGRAVRQWCEDGDFLDRYNDAVEAARDEVVQKARSMALEGSEPMLGLLVRAYTPELRPAGTQVAVGVKVGGGSVEDARLRRLQAMTDEQLLAEFDRFHRDLQTRAEYGRHERVAAAAPAGGEVVDVQALPVPEALSGPISDLPEDPASGAASDEAGGTDDRL